MNWGRESQNLARETLGLRKVESVLRHTLAPVVFRNRARERNTLLGRVPQPGRAGNMHARSASLKVSGVSALLGNQWGNNKPRKPKVTVWNDRCGRFRRTAQARNHRTMA